MLNGLVKLVAMRAGILGLAAAVCGVGFAQTLPAGHPPMGTAGGGGMPAGHPPMGGTDAGAAEKPSGQMPPGHPTMEQMQQMMAEGGGAATQPGDAPATKIKGKLTVLLVAGTAGGGTGANEEVTVELFHQGVVVKKYDAKADGEGKVELSDLPVMPLDVRVSVKHAGLLQQAPAPAPTPEAPEQTMKMKVYETTEDAPSWKIDMGHVLVHWIQNEAGERTAARVTQMYVMNAAGDRVWLGKKTGELRSTMTIALPAGVSEVTLTGGFDNEKSVLTEGQLVSGGGLYPGRSIYKFAYTLPVKDGGLVVPITMPAALGSLMVSVPADDAQVTATGLKEGEMKKVSEEESVRMYRAQDLAAGAQVTLSFSKLTKSESKLTARNIAMGGAFLMVLVAVGMLLMRKPAKAPEGQGDKVAG